MCTHPGKQTAVTTINLFLVTIEAKISGLLCAGPQAEPDNNYKTIEPIKLRLLKQTTTSLCGWKNKNKAHVARAGERKRNRDSLKPQWPPMDGKSKTK